MELQDDDFSSVEPLRTLSDIVVFFEGTDALFVGWGSA